MATSVLSGTRSSGFAPGGVRPCGKTGAAPSGTGPIYVAQPGAIRNGCPADFNSDGVSDPADFFAFLGTFFEGRTIADVNTDGFINSQDFFDFLVRFFAGCAG